MISNRVKILGARYSTFVALFVLLLLFGLWNSRFTTVSNYEIILLNIAELGLIVIPLAFLVMSGSVDLSVGSVASAGAVICALTMEHTHSVLLGIGAGLLFGIVAGAINGLLVAVLDLNPIVITLGFLGAWGGLALYLTQGATVANFPSGSPGSAASRSARCRFSSFCSRWPSPSAGSCSRSVPSDDRFWRSAGTGARHTSWVSA